VGDYDAFWINSAKLSVFMVVFELQIDKASNPVTFIPDFLTPDQMMILRLERDLH
jgi:hypothetical protein